MVLHRSDLKQRLPEQFFFGLDKKLGQLTLTLKFAQCYEAEFYASDLGLDAPEDKRLNFGECMLKGLFGKWAMDSGLKYGEDMDPVDVWGSGWVNRKKMKIPSFRFWDDARAKRKQKYIPST